MAAVKNEAHFVIAGFPYRDFNPHPSPRLELGFIDCSFTAYQKSLYAEEYQVSKYDAVQSGTHLPTFRRTYTTNTDPYLRTTVKPDGILRVKNALTNSVYYITELTIGETYNRVRVGQAFVWRVSY